MEPTLPFIPASVHPNTITHTGHLVCLAGLLLLAAYNPSRGWMFLASMALLQAYNWCDNADGAHARRTRQSSVLGEFLDHGLDILNTLYIGLMTVLALGSSPEYAIALAILITPRPRRSPSGSRPRRASTASASSTRSSPSRCCPS